MYYDSKKGEVTIHKPKQEYSYKLTVDEVLLQEGFEIIKFLAVGNKEKGEQEHIIALKKNNKYFKILDYINKNGVLDQIVLQEIIEVSK